MFKMRHWNLKLWKFSNYLLDIEYIEIKTHKHANIHKSAETCHPVSLPCKGTRILIFVTCGPRFYLRVWYVQPPIQSLYPWVRCISMQECSVHSLMFFIPMGVINFYMQERFFTLAGTTFIPMVLMYLHATMFCTLTCLPFPFVQCQSLKPVLS